MSSDQPAREEFAKLLKRFRLRAKETQLEFADRLPISRSYYSMIERCHRPPPEQLRDELVRLYPRERDEIEALYDAVEEEEKLRASSSAGRRQTASQRAIVELMRVGRNREARASITRELRTNGDPGTRVWLLDHLVCIEIALGNVGAVMDLACEAIETAHMSGLHEDERRLRQLLARRLARQADYSAAHAVIDEGLMHHPDAADLWYRKGILHWYEHDYPPAAACFMSAEASGLSKREFFYARGAVSAEWGHFARAIDDLTFAIEHPDTPIEQAAHARSARAWALANSGQVERALAEWEVAEEVTPENAWLHYFRARCYGELGDTDRMLAGLCRALDCEAPALNQPKRVHATELLQQYECASKAS